MADLKIKKTRRVDRPRGRTSVAMERSELLESRRTLFRFGLTPGEFFSFAAQLLATQDERIVELVQEAAEIKRQKTVVRKEFASLGVSDIYEMIEQSNNHTREITCNDQGTIGTYHDDGLCGNEDTGE